MDHLIAAMEHFERVVGVGPHGLVALHDGDWDDTATQVPGYTAGESVETTAGARRAGRAVVARRGWQTLPVLTAVAW